MSNTTSAAYENLKLENQLCFPLYAAAKEVVRLYTPHLNPLGLTYTQYIVMMVIWDEEEIVVKDLCERLYLDTGTLTPLLRKLAEKELIRLTPRQQDRRSVVACATKKGLALREKAVTIPSLVGSCVKLSQEEAMQLYTLSYKVLAGLKPQEQEA
ncbi:MAG: MarR family winged helix-turn-helix transcriptional regulator [Raoultibacter sp.]|jgi:DNA-binding MarR family transcriptional regulator